MYTGPSATNSNVRSARCKVLQQPSLQKERDCDVRLAVCAGNAVKFTPAPGVDQGEVLVSIIRESISGDGQQIQLKFSIKDTGAGRVQRF